MSFKRIVLSITILIFLCIIFYFLILVKGNPISRINTEKVLKTYLENTYPQNEFHINYYRYDPEFGYYLFYVRNTDDHNKTKYLFEVPTFLSEENEIEDGIFYAHLDEVLNEKWSKEVIIDIKQNLADIAPAIREAEVYVYVLEDRYAEGASWDPSKKMDKPMNIHH